MITRFVAICCIAGLLPILSCQDFSSGPTAHNVFSRQLTNIPWILSGINIDGRIVNPNDYQPFSFFVSDTSVYGDDGCNYYFADSRIDGDILAIGWGWGTQMACLYEKPEFDYRQLAHRWVYKVFNLGLELQSKDTTFIFRAR